ncbi:hypothetical protein C7S18_04745 [Ahniella affigens]|uniref:ORC1/DEAH AAA+ ATPase domain-containing protein n=1 Tax=Ahniella affigens TaxID=2021234 RepID=A0A2P1PNY4_9GAMM|nr:AAA family ATPase [Ahniella affigens]AVP96549.1 hypothetical protein C7S18_04745 [Ahniella affigens]
MFSRPPWWRMLLVAALSWLVLSNWLLPELNPFRFARIGADAETGSMLALVRHSMQQIKVESVDYLTEHQAWPKAPIDIYEPDNNGLIALSMPAHGVLSIRMVNGFDRSTGLRDTELLLTYDAKNRRWHCQPGQPAPPDAWLFDECRLPDSGAMSPWWIALFIVMLSIPLSWIWLARFDPILASIQSNPRLLRTIPLNRLPAVHWRLRSLFRTSSTLAVAGISEPDWQLALRWRELAADERLNQLAQRLAAVPAPWPHGQWPGCFQLWQLPPTFPLALERVLVYLPNADLSHHELLQWLRHQRLSDDVFLVVSPNVASDKGLNAWASDSNHIAAYADQSVLTEWLLAPSAETVLADLFAKQLPVTRISPYQTRGGITRPSGFFGRQQELARILNREPSNYLLVGGRQLGKTSLMKAVERHYAGHPEVACRYVSLRDHRLRARLSQWVDADADLPLAALLQLMQQQTGKSRLLLLIDECDLFLRDDARSGYPQLSELRALSEEGQCRFILAGFWDLYEAVALDFASPIRNFGDVLRLGPLDEAACLALATEPMQRLGLQFEHLDLPQHLIEQCGHRANLIAIICQQLLEQAKQPERVLTRGQLEVAMKSEAIQDALTGWSKLSPFDLDNRFDRALVYQVALNTLSGAPELDLPSWVATLASAGIRAASEQLRKSLLRLELAYVLKRVSVSGTGVNSDTQSTYQFAVPLQSRSFTLGETRVLLEGELAGLDP